MAIQTEDFDPFLCPQAKFQDNIINYAMSIPIHYSLGILTLDAR